MYQYKAVLKADKSILFQDHTIEDIEKLIVGWRRRNKDKNNGSIEIVHVHRPNNNVVKEKIIKVV